MTIATGEPVIRVKDVVVQLGTRKILNGIHLDLLHGEILGFVGASGAGKSVLTRTIVGLLPKREGTIEVLGVDLDTADHEAKQAVDRRWGVMFQQGALFSSLTSGKNVEFPIREYLGLSQKLTTEIAIAKLEMVGLKPDVYRNYPSELSGGMIKRVALARALALDPEILFLDEPTSGLDPISAADFDELIMTLQETLGVSIFMVTHDLDSLHRTCDRIAVLGEGKIVECGTMEKMLASEHPWLKSYFHGVRAHDDWHIPVKG
ncbi:MAG: ABC transporter ATP-binding protein [Pseudolabrys sp.]|nr:ABC transporter ATP-binding protein [Pseudolabrys sp.]